VLHKPCCATGLIVNGQTCVAQNSLRNMIDREWAPLVTVHHPSSFPDCRHNHCLPTSYDTYYTQPRGQTKNHDSTRLACGRLGFDLQQGHWFSSSSPRPCQLLAQAPIQLMAGLFSGNEPAYRSRYSNCSMSWVTHRFGFVSRQGQEIFLFYIASRLTLGPTQPLVQCVRATSNLTLYRLNFF
jgi:hypothetical protein